MRKLIPYLFLLWSTIASAQSPCSVLENYIPTGDEPEVIIKVKLHIVQYAENDPRNYTIKDTSLLREQINLINSFYTALDAPTLLPPAEADHLRNAHIRFKIIGFKFHVNPDLWDRIAYEPLYNKQFPIAIDSQLNTKNTFYIKGQHGFRFRRNTDVLLIDANKKSFQSKIDTAYFDKSVKKTVIKTVTSCATDFQPAELTYFAENNRNCSDDLFKQLTHSDSSCLHIFYTGSSMKESAFGCGPSPFYLNVSNYLKGGDWANAQLSAHELGHCLGLSHTDRPQFDDLPKKDKFGFIDCDSVEVSNNIMGYNKCRRYLSPKQIAFIHQEYSLKPYRIRTTVYCDYDPQYNFEIRKNTTWNRAMVIGGDLIIRKGKTLTVNCMVSLPDGANIILEEGSQLIVNGNVITNNCGSTWDGILFCSKYTGDKTKMTPPKKTKGEVKLQNGGRLERVKNNP